MAALAASLSAFAASLDSNRSSLVRSQGADWVERMRAGHASLVDIHGKLLAADSELRNANEVVTSGSASLVQLARTTQARVPKPASKAAMPSSSAVTAAPATTVIPVDSVSTPAPELPPATTLTVTESPNQRRPMMAWLSGAVLAILFLLSIVMAVRIVRPVRHLMRATRKLSEGELTMRVARGGISELDSLAMSFNAMAERLEAAHAITVNHQRELEEKVDERTRQLQHLAEHDPLTELPNRRQLFSQLEQALKQAVAEGSLVGVMVLDLDNFKNINDSKGHAYGDLVLQCVAQRLEKDCRSIRQLGAPRGRRVHGHSVAGHERGRNR